MGRDDNTQLIIVVHTDSVGNENYNLGLSVRRPQSAARSLMQQGIDYTRIETEEGVNLSPLQITVPKPVSRKIAGVRSLYTEVKSMSKSLKLRSSIIFLSPQ